MPKRLRETGWKSKLNLYPLTVSEWERKSDGEGSQQKELKFNGNLFDRI